MRILILTTGCFDKGGVSRFSRYQATALREIYGQEKVRVLSLLGPDEHALEEPFEVTWHGTRFGLVDKMKLIAVATQQATGWRPDVILAAHISLAALVQSLSRLIRAKSVLNVYGLELWTSPRRSSLWGLKQVDYVIADCHSTADYVTSNELRKKSLNVIWDCVDTERFQPHDCPKEVMNQYGLYSPKENFVVMTLGRLAKAAYHKGYHRLIKVFSQLVVKFPNARLLICGRGDMRQELESLCVEQGIADKVRFTGAIDEKDLPSVYATASVFSLVSEKGNGRGEGIPMTPMEAMACGVPIIVGNHDGSKESIVENNGFVIDPFDLDTHANCLEQLARDSEMCSSMGLSARRVSESTFSYKRFVDEHRQLFQQIDAGK